MKGVLDPDFRLLPLYLDAAGSDGWRLHRWLVHLDVRHCYQTGHLLAVGEPRNGEVEAHGEIRQHRQPDELPHLRQQRFVPQIRLEAVRVVAREQAGILLRIGRGGCQ